MAGHQFISYSSADALEFAFKLHEALEAGTPHVPAWLDRRDIKPGQDWDSEIVEAIRACASFLFILSPDSVEDQSVCKLEWTRALSYKKPIVPLLFRPGVELPFRLANRQFIDFIGTFDQPLAQLRNHLTWLESPAGALRGLEERLADARRDLRRAQGPEHEARVRDDLAQLELQVEAQRRIVADPEGAAKRAEESIARGLERERQPSRPISGVSRTKFLNPPPAVAPSYFQGRHDETRLIGDFLRDDAKRLMTVLGRGGIGKTATVCRLLKALEAGQLPDDGGPLEVEGIIYHSAIGSRRVNAPNLYADLLALLPPETARRVEPIVKDPKADTEAKMRALLDAFPDGRTVLLLDNFEDVVDPETFNIADAELSETLHALLKSSHHGVKVILTTRIAPRALNLTQPGRQTRLDLDGGLESPHAENILREMDADGKLGLKTAPAELLVLARERTRGFPRALEALFAILSADRETTLIEILADASTRLPENVTEALVGDAFSRLDPVAQKVMQALAIFGRPVPPAAVDYLLQPHQPGVDAAPVLDRLVNMHFARKEAGRYYLHPVDREFALARLHPGNPSDRNGESTFTRRGLQHGAAEYFEQARLPRESWKTIDDLLPQLAEFDLRLAIQDYETAARLLKEISLDYLIRWGWNRLAMELNARLLDYLEDSKLKSRILSDLAHSCSALGQRVPAIGYHEKALAINRQIGNRGEEGIHLGNLGCCYSSLGQVERAIGLHEQALAIKREVGNRREQGITLSNLGHCYTLLGHIELAIGLHEQALDIMREVGDRLGESINLGNLGSCFSSLGRIGVAIGLHERALSMKREVGNRREEGMTLGSLGHCYSSLGQIELAIEMHLKSQAIAREIGNRLGEGYVSLYLSVLSLDKGCQEDSTRQAKRPYGFGEQCKAPVIISLGNGTLALARLCVEDLPGAHAAIEAACLVDVPSNTHRILALLGLIALRQGDRATSIEAASAAISHADVMLGYCGRNYEALDARGLALACLAVVDEGHRGVPCGSGDHEGRRGRRSRPAIARPAGPGRSGGHPGRSPRGGMSGRSVIREVRRSW